MSALQKSNNKKYREMELVWNFIKVYNEKFKANFDLEEDLNQEKPDVIVKDRGVLGLELRLLNFMRMES